MLWEKFKPYAAVKYPRPIALRDSAVRENEHVVVFDVLGDGIGVKLIKGKEIVETHYKKWKQEDLENDVKRFLMPFESMKLREFDAELAKKFYNQLLMRVIADVPHGTPLTIIPDGILAVVPFEALVVSGNATWKETGGRSIPEGLTYLGDVYPISYYQSITALTLARTMKKEGKIGGRSLVIADPIFQDEDERVKSGARTKQKELLTHLPQTLMSIKNATGLTFQRLTLTRNLGESLKKLDPAKTDLLLDEQCQKSALFKKPLADYGTMVFATHGYFGKDIPMIQEPVLAMTLVDQLKDQDGFLRMSEVMGLKLNADIVALTACQTGLGKNLSGEGVMSMGRAFQYAGAKSILMSLWSVSENASVLLVEKFFANLKAGKNKLEALRRAREGVRKAGYNHPFYWAPFILVGEVN